MDVALHGALRFGDMWVQAVLARFFDCACAGLDEDFHERVRAERPSDASAICQVLEALALAHPAKDVLLYARALAVYAPHWFEKPATSPSGHRSNVPEDPAFAVRDGVDQPGAPTVWPNEASAREEPTLQDALVAALEDPRPDDLAEELIDRWRRLSEKMQRQICEGILRRTPDALERWVQRSGVSGVRVPEAARRPPFVRRQMDAALYRALRDRDPWVQAVLARFFNGTCEGINAEFLARTRAERPSGPSAIRRVLEELALAHPAKDVLFYARALAVYAPQWFEKPAVESSGTLERWPEGEMDSRPPAAPEMLERPQVQLAFWGPAAHLSRIVEMLYGTRIVLDAQGRADAYLGESGFRARILALATDAGRRHPASYRASSDLHLLLVQDRLIRHDRNFAEALSQYSPVLALVDQGDSRFRLVRLEGPSHQPVLDEAIGSTTTVHRWILDRLPGDKGSAYSRLLEFSRERRTRRAREFEEWLRRTLGEDGSDARGANRLLVAAFARGGLRAAFRDLVAEARSGLEVESDAVCERLPRVVTELERAMRDDCVEHIDERVAEVRGADVRAVECVLLGAGTPNVKQLTAELERCERAHLRAIARGEPSLARFSEQLGILAIPRPLAVQGRTASPRARRGGGEARARARGPLPRGREAEERRDAPKRSRGDTRGGGGAREALARFGRGTRAPRPGSGRGRGAESANQRHPSARGENVPSERTRHAVHPGYQ
ncbi:MAG: hypothetical protein QM765_38950 [Myxococcales bacterium]